MPPIYTRRGDSGMTDMYSGERVGKDSAVLGVLGANDELTSRIGVAICYISDATVVAQLRQIQTWLQQINGDLATWKPHNPFFPNAEPVTKLEAWIDEMDRHLERLTAFILPGGKSIAGSHLHMCRTACRAAERLYVAYDVQEDRIMQFINRLSDYFFTVARYTELERRAKWNNRIVASAAIAILMIAAAYLW